MLSLETLDLLLAITEGELIEEMIIGMLAAPQLSIFFKKFPAIRRALEMTREERLRALDEATPDQGLRAFVWAVEAMI